MRYEGTVYRPPSEANSLLIQATIGCPHNKCTFCSMYKDTRFRVRKLPEILEDIKMAREYYRCVRSMFLPDGNTILRRTKELVEILEFAKATFPELERITVYGSAKFIKLKTIDELKTLRQAGLTRIHSGLESGDPEILKLIKKGATPEDMIEAGRKVKEAGIELSEYYLVGIGGLSRWKQHATNSAKVLSAIDPHFIRLRTYVPVPGSPLFEDYQKGEFELLDAHDALREVKLLIENLEGTGQLLSDHISNFWNVNGSLATDKATMIEELDYALTLNRNNFRPQIIMRLSLIHHQKKINLVGILMVLRLFKC